MVSTLYNSSRGHSPDAKLNYEARNDAEEAVVIVVAATSQSQQFIKAIDAKRSIGALNLENYIRNNC